MITIQLTPSEMQRLMRPVGLPRERQGGFQRLIERLQTSIRQDTLQLRMSVKDAERVVAYADPKYGPGTYQEQLRCIGPKVSQALAALGPRQSGSLFGDDEE